MWRRGLSMDSNAILPRLESLSHLYQDNLKQVTYVLPISVFCVKFEKQYYLPHGVDVRIK